MCGVHFSGQRTHVPAVRQFENYSSLNGHDSNHGPVFIVDVVGAGSWLTGSSDLSVIKREQSRSYAQWSVSAARAARPAPMAPAELPSPASRITASSEGISFV